MRSLNTNDIISPYSGAPTDPLEFGIWAAHKVQEHLPDQRVQVEWDQIAKVLLIQIDDYHLVEEGKLSDLMLRFLRTLELVGYPFNIGLGDPNDPWLRVTHPDFVLPPLRNAA